MIETYPNAGALADAAAHGIVAQLAEALRMRGRAALVATGGRSPGPVFDRLAASDAVDWSRVVVTLSDERCVDEADPASNARQVRERLFQARAAKAHLLPLWPPPAVEALTALAPFDAVMLGMGEDGHIASLIPGDPGLQDGLATKDMLRSVPAGLGKPPVARITLTLRALLDARAIFLLIAGEAKRAVIEQALAGADLPVARLLGQSKVPVRILWTPDGG
ncbi:6-phosphogluconolactonase [Phenylobacterium kunshanense]|uniref:6-phosphogluconolactonase n=1 Tax=Phenylobacterium kunshanense TaxID=1445034 RepID=A0A328BJA5_9CAUL|nr:6-phosphogluconolactonase [Phenylobacterium kunshanense]RAK67243.1 6-phosphogluconolactonase [Phenylobacterium kunshanense]